MLRLAIFSLFNAYSASGGLQSSIRLSFIYNLGPLSWSRCTTRTNVRFFLLNVTVATVALKKVDQSDKF